MLVVIKKYKFFTRKTNFVDLLIKLVVKYRPKKIKAIVNGKN